MSQNYEHIRWKRLPSVSLRQKKRGFGSTPPLRTSREKHSQELDDAIKLAIEDRTKSRRLVGIDPSNLLVLSFVFSESDERELLEKLGLQVVQEREVTELMQVPYYSVLLSFKAALSLESFLEREKLNTSYKMLRTRNSSGQPDQKNLELHFTDRQRASQFCENTKEQQISGISKCSGPAKKIKRTSFKLLVQFNNEESLTKFQSEFLAYASRLGQTESLTEKQRMKLFDAIEEISTISASDRMGERLAKEGKPSKGKFYLDVDLWHPGTQPLLREASDQFSNLVNSTGGRITDPLTTVADSLLIARVEGGVETLESLLNYDRVARVDLPPILSGIDFSVARNIEAPEQIECPSDDGPLACILDSGLVSTHPLLSGLVVDERDFDSGENTPVDKVGHGTHVAGIVAYGDIHKCITENIWRPRIRILSAKIMRSITGFTGGPNFAGFANEERVETQIRKAIKTFHKEYGCRIFNLSFGNSACSYGPKGQLPWAYLIDELSKQLDVVIIVAAGNVTNPNIPQANTEPEFQRLVREQLFSEEHRLIDPASAVLALTVGAITRNARPWQNQQYPHRRIVVGAPANAPAPFTRTSIVDSNGDGLRRIIKPELVSFGGNYSLGVVGTWNKNDPGLGEFSLKHNYQEGVLLAASSGTSTSAPYVTHVAALVESSLRNRADSSVPPSANLIRALVVHSANVPKDLENWITDGHSKSDGEERLLKSVGYGMPDPEKAIHSADNRAVLFAEDQLSEDHFHLYELEIPNDFVQGNSKRELKITLAYDPPVSGTRKEYISRTMWFDLFRGLTREEILSARSAQSGNRQKVSFGSKEVEVRPTYTTLQWSTVQSAIFRGKSQSTFDYRASSNDPVVWHILVGSSHRFEMGAALEQNYALVVSLEHSDQLAKINLPIRQKNTARVKQHWN